MKRTFWWLAASFLLSACGGGGGSGCTCTANGADLDVECPPSF